MGCGGGTFYGEEGSCPGRRTKLGNCYQLYNRFIWWKEKADRWSWTADYSGTFTVASAWSFMQGLEMEEPIMAFEQLWKGLAPSNVLVFAWKAMWGRVPTKHILRRRGALPSEVPLTCVFCENAVETAEHHFFSCPFSAKVWDHCNRWFSVSNALPQRCQEHFLRSSEGEQNQFG